MWYMIEEQPGSSSSWPKSFQMFVSKVNSHWDDYIKYFNILKVIEKLYLFYS